MGLFDRIKQTGSALKLAGQVAYGTLKRTIMEDLVGIKETKEVLTAALRMLRVARTVGSDGWKMTDVSLIITDQELMQVVADALNGAGQIPAELNSLTFGETMELAQYALDGMAELSKPPLLPPAPPAPPVTGTRSTGPVIKGKGPTDGGPLG